MDKLILDGKDYGEDYISYNRDYNNKVWEQLRMKQLNEIPQLQSKRRVIKRHVIHDFKSHQRKIFWQDLIFSCIIFAMLIATVILFTFDIDTSLHW